MFSSIPAHGHTYPLLPLAVAAKAQGHSITYATGENFHPTLARLGFDTVAAGRDIGGAFVEVAGGPVSPAEMQSRSPEEMRRIISRVFGVVLPSSFIADLRPVLAERAPDLVVYESACPGAGIAAKAAGIPAVCHGIGRGVPAGQLSALLADIVPLAEAAGVDYDVEHGRGRGDALLDIYPLSIQDPAATAAPRRVPLRPVAFADPGELPGWVTEPGEPIVYLTLGTSFGSVEVLRTAIHALAATGARVLVAAGPTVDVAALGEPPANVTIESWVPQADLLPHVDLVVHHGGAGTTLGAAGAGVPQLFLPQGADQFTNAEAVTGFNAGRQLLPADTTAERITENATALLTDTDVAEAVAALAADIATMPTPEDVAKRLPEFA
ncbi:glycosyl transferase [Actinokineospora sp. NBRC 105648]|nr:glycosyl transferase [Actinokineospora sp. NBRC 105648]